MTIAPVHADGHITLDADGRLAGRARRVPFARNAGHIAVLAHRGDERGGGAGRDRRACRSATTRASPASRATPCRSTAPPRWRSNPPPSTKTRSSALAPPCGCSRWPGALETILDQSVQWALDRSQFGRPIAKFQAVQHNLATLAGEVAAAGAAADLAAEACAGADLGEAEVAIAKVRAGEAAGAGAAIAHQVHGAMGFTYEHTLHHATRRLWSWREEFGNETVWATRLGRMVAARGADRLWPFITQGS